MCTLCPTNRSARTPTLEKPRKLSKTSFHPTDKLQSSVLPGYVTVWKCSHGMEGGREAWPGQPCQPRPDHAVLVFLDQPTVRLLTRTTARRFRDLLAAVFVSLSAALSEAETQARHQPNSHCQFTHDKPFRVRSWPY